MKNYISLLSLTAVLLFACNKGNVNTFPEGTSYGNSGLTYQQITGIYKMYDSIHFIGNQAYQPIDNKFVYPLNKNESFAISVENGVGVFTYQGQKFVETKGVANEYMTASPYYDIAKIRFNKDTVFVNFFKQEYSNDSSLNITVRGYKLF